IALALRSYTILNISTLDLPDKKTVVISVFPQSGESLADILEVAYEDSTIDAVIGELRRKGQKGFLVHVMPRHYMMQGLFVTTAYDRMPPAQGRSLGRIARFVFPFLGGGSRHRQMMGEDAAMGPVRLVFSQLTWPGGEYASFEDALGFRVKHLPFLRADVDPAGGVVRAVERTSLRNFWGQMPMPAF
ncbi:MAG: hypothetical protein ACE5GH_07220, partial [Fidelibacterota bacterium]